MRNYTIIRIPFRFWIVYKTFYCNMCPRISTVKSQLSEELVDRDRNGCTVTEIQVKDPAEDPKTLQEQKSEWGCCVTACANVVQHFHQKSSLCRALFSDLLEGRGLTVNMVPANSIVKPPPNEATVGSIGQLKVARSVYRGEVAATGKCFCCLHACGWQIKWAVYSNTQNSIERTLLTTSWWKYSPCPVGSLRLASITRPTCYFEMFAGTNEMSVSDKKCLSGMYTPFKPEHVGPLLEKDEYVSQSPPAKKPKKHKLRD